MSATLPRAGILGEDGVHLYPVHVYYEDTDAGGIVYHANYLKFAERARSEMLRALDVGHERMRREAGIVFVVRRAGIEFRAPARLDDDLVVMTRLARLSGAALELDQDVLRDEAALVRLKLSIACVGAGGRPVRLPALLLAALAPFNETSRMVTSHAT
jgi:acyl-CoA thioester hydrolase